MSWKNTLGSFVGLAVAIVYLALPIIILLYWPGLVGTEEAPPGERPDKAEEAWWTGWEQGLQDCSEP